MNIPEIHDITFVNDMIVIAESEELTAEVILFALLAIKKNPEISIEEACNIGLGEWIK